jgi:hypothetical protein
MLERVGDVDTRKSVHMHINYAGRLRNLRPLACSL